MKTDIMCQILCLFSLTVIISVHANTQNDQWTEDGEGGFILSGKREVSDTNGRRRINALRSRQTSRGSNVLMELASNGHISQQDMQQFTSAPPSAADVNCYVEVEEIVYESHPGRCIRLGRTGIHACKASGYMDINNVECIRRANTPATNPPQQVTTTPVPMK